MENFKGTKELRIIGSNQAGFAIGNDEDSLITVWGDDDEAKANVQAILHMSEMLEMLKECQRVLSNVQSPATTSILLNREIEDLLKRATTI